MKKITTLLAVGVVTFGLSVTAYAGPGPDDDPRAEMAELDASAKAAVSKAAWGAFSKNLVNALKSDHDGLREAAMRFVIQYGDQVNVKAAVFDVMRIYRNHDNQNLRRMAVVTLGHMNSDWAISFLRLSTDYESSDALRHTIRAVVESRDGGGKALNR
ncbi:hypothetical protein [Rhodocaloribacter sp.]